MARTSKPAAYRLDTERTMSGAIKDQNQRADISVVSGVLEHYDMTRESSDVLRLEGIEVGNNPEGGVAWIEQALAPRSIWNVKAGHKVSLLVASIRGQQWVVGVSGNGHSLYDAGPLRRETGLTRKRAGVYAGIVVLAAILGIFWHPVFAVIALPTLAGLVKDLWSLARGPSIDEIELMARRHSMEPIHNWRVDQL